MERDSHAETIACDSHSEQEREKESAGGRSSVVYSQMAKDSHADPIVCGSNCIIMHFTGKEFDVSPYTDTYEAIKSVPILKAATACDNPETSIYYN
jgi:hypothetical protein